LIILIIVKLHCNKFPEFFILTCHPYPVPPLFSWNLASGNRKNKHH
jgi:hypothetical protein